MFLKKKKCSLRVSEALKYKLDICIGENFKNDKKRV